MKKITLITGGSRSGKSRYALKLIGTKTKKSFIATAEPFDEEMRDRIVNHQKERGELFFTIEEPLDLARAIRSLPPNIEIAVIDCLTVWLGNLIHQYGIKDENYPEVTSFLEVLIKDTPCDLIIVTNEVGMGIIPPNKLSRKFSDLAGNLNQSVARLADQVILMVSGFPVIVKGDK